MKDTTPSWEEPTTEQLFTIQRVARVDRDVVRRQAEDVAGSALVTALLDWIDGFVLVLNGARQIVAASTSFLTALGHENAEEVVGLRIGEALGCVYPDAGEGGCGTAPSCRHCGSLRAILQSSEHEAPTEAEYKVITRAETGGELTRKFRSRVVPIEVGGETYTALILQRPETSPGVAEVPAAWHEEPNWPSALLRYTRLRQLGSGGMGTVLLVSDDEGRSFALKFVRVPERASPRYVDSIRQRFRLETEVGLNLHHPNIVRVFESGSTLDGTFYFVSEFCPYGSTSTHLQRLGTFPVDAALFWMIGAARGLDHAWRENRVVHRDIKPDNLLIGDGFLLKIADFGIAQRKTGEESLDLTSSGMVVGSARYMAPEQAYAPHEVDNRTDLYSLGATFYHLLSGAPPFTGANPIQTMMHHAHTSLVPLCQRRPRLPEALGEVVDGLLAKRLDDRPASAAAVVAQLEGLAAELGLDPDRPPESAMLVAHPELAESGADGASAIANAETEDLPALSRWARASATTRSLRPDRKR